MVVYKTSAWDLREIKPKSILSEEQQIEKLVEALEEKKACLDLQLPILSF